MLPDDSRSSNSVLESQLPPSWVARLTEELESEVVERQAEASEHRVVLTRNLSKLAEERQKLLRAYYANAVPLELLKAEQDRITTQEKAARAELSVTEADLRGWQEVLTLAIRLAGNCHRAVNTVFTILPLTMCTA